jgi:hypothetical protein
VTARESDMSTVRRAGTRAARGRVPGRLWKSWNNQIQSIVAGPMEF